MTDSKNKHGSVDNVATSVSSIKLSGATNSLDDKSTPVAKSDSSQCTENADVSKCQTGANPIGNLNLPHIAHSSNQQKCGNSNATLSTSQSPHVIDKRGNHSSLEDFEVLSTIGTGTFGRVVLVKERHTKEYFALKVMKIFDIIKLKQVEHVKNEKNILSQVQHPFVVQLYWTYHDDTFLYMLLEFVCGGELFSYLRNAGRFNNTTSLFYASEIVCALDYLHSLHIVYRDLKPENILLDRDGHTKLTDFGFSKKVEDRTWTLCGTPEYLAPEVIRSKGHGKSVDWWALGIIIYEMLVGFPPFWDESPFGIYQKILGGKLEFTKNLEDSAKDLIKRLLTADRTRRLGNMKNGADDVKRHAWFHTIEWAAVEEKKMLPPIIPRVRHSGDTRNFEDYPEENWRAAKRASDSAIALFDDF